MITENMQKWIEALESGEYTQTRGSLRDGFGYCCLGVACDIYHKETGQGTWNGSVQTSTYEAIPFIDSDEGCCTYYLPRTVMDWLGIGSRNGACLHDGERITLSKMNDKGETYHTIARILRSEPLWIQGLT